MLRWRVTGGCYFKQVDKEWALWGEHIQANSWLKKGARNLKVYRKGTFQVEGRERGKALQKVDWFLEVGRVDVAEYIFKQRKRESRFLYKK